MGTFVRDSVLLEDDLPIDGACALCSRITILVLAPCFPVLIMFVSLL